MAKLSKEQKDLFKALHESRLEDYRILNKKSYRGIWNSVIEKYPESAHFVYELLQNADDAVASEVYIIVNRHEMLFKHNGTKRFDISTEDAIPVGDINSITGIGDSSKVETENKIGKFGVGFKAVFQYTETPEIYDDYFKFKIENYIVPTMLTHDHKERKEGETLFVFPFKNEEESYKDIVGRLEQLQNPILFLRNLRKIVWRVDSEDGRKGKEQTYSKTLVEKKVYEDNTWLELYKLIEGSDTSSIFLFSMNIRIKSENKVLPISVGYYYDDDEQKLITDTKQKIFCFFPTKETFGTCFISHAPFLLTDNRQNLKPNSEYNKSLIRHLADLAAKAIVHLRDYGKEKRHLLINENISSIIPQYKKNHWSRLDDLFEQPIIDAFSNLIEKEEIFLSRAAKYMKLSDAYTGTPRELVALLTQKQLSSLVISSTGDDTKTEVNFIKWELAQNIMNRDDVLFEEINHFTSEDFGRTITADFMAQQEVKWVVRFYTFLRTAAPKLWKKTGPESRTSTSKLIFRTAPIIKTQKGDWVSPYLPDGNPNIFLPLKKDVKSNYNFVAEDYLNIVNAKRFFDELNIKEPNELDYIKSVILPKFSGYNFKIDDDDLISDFEVLISYFLKQQEGKDRNEYIQLVSKHVYLVDSEGDLTRPSDMFFYNPILADYFNSDSIFIDLDFYGNSIKVHGRDRVISFMGLLGVNTNPSVVGITRYNLNETSALSMYSHYRFECTRFKIDDFELEGFSDLISKNRINKELSLYLWNELLPAIDLKQYENLTFNYWRRYARHYDNLKTTSTFKFDLLRLKWLYNNDGELVNSYSLYLEDLPHEYNRDNGLIEFLRISRREPSIKDLGGSDEQQKDYDFGKRIREEFGDDLTEEEIIEKLIELKAEKNRKQNTTKNKSEEISDSASVSQEAEHEALQSKLNEKWERMANDTVGKPSSSPKSPLPPSEYASSDRDERKNQQFFDEKYTNHSEDASKFDSSSIERKLKSKEKEAKESAEKSSELVQILELLNQEERFTFRWYKLLMELMHANKSEKMKRHAQIDFTECEFICSDTVLHLTNPSQPIPDWVAECENYALTALGANSHKIIGRIVKADDVSVDLSVEKDETLEEICSKASTLRLTADASTDFIDSLEMQFLKLKFEDDFNMNDNLPANIRFIYGPPGTGKTTRLVEIVNGLLASPEKKTNILILTPTNKAADVVCRMMVDDEICYKYLTRFGSTEDLDLIEEFDVVSNRETTDLDLLPHNIVVTTAARYAYDYLQPDDTFICDIPWDHIIIDEASMIDILTVTYILYKGASSNIIISGDPMQIQPVSQNDMPEYNVYDLVDLHGFADALQNFNRFHVEALTVQHRSVPTIGKLVSQYAYDGIVQADPERDPQKPLELDGIELKDINFIGFNVIELDPIHELTAVNGSAFHLYSALFTYNMVKYTAEQIQTKYSGKHYSIGIVCPYRAESDAIKLMLENNPISNINCTITCGTVHSFQGGQCDIMFVVLNPPLICSRRAHINNQNIINVAMSRARDYLFFVLPEQQVRGFTSKNDIIKLCQKGSYQHLLCSDIENVIWGMPNYIASNTHVTCHMPVNVYSDYQAKYEVRIADDALDIKINE